MDEEKLKEWGDELQRRREAKGFTRRARVPDDREPGPDTCYAKTGGKTRHGNPCLLPGKPQFGNGCFHHPQPLTEEQQEVQANREKLVMRPPTSTSGAKGGDRWKILSQMLEDEGIPLSEFVKQLSPEELARGQIKATDGSFRGAPPKWVPRAFMQACVSELMRRGKELYQENYVAAIKVMIDLATSADVEGPVRMRAAQFVIERLEGKTPEKLIVETRDSFATKVEELEAAMAEDEQLQRVKERLAKNDSAATA